MTYLPTAGTSVPTSMTQRGTNLIRSTVWHANRTQNQPVRPVINDEEVVGYARYSTSAQREESIERQIESIKRAAVVRKVKLVRMFVDREISGAVSRRATVDPVQDAEGTGDACRERAHHGRKALRLRPRSGKTG